MMIQSPKKGRACGTPVADAFVFALQLMLANRCYCTWFMPDVIRGCR